MIRRVASHSSLGLVVVLALSLIAIAPLLRADAPCTHDGGPHHFRVVALRHALENGMSLALCLEQVSALRKQGTGVPLLLMGYYNPIL